MAAAEDRPVLVEHADALRAAEQAARGSPDRGTASGRSAGGRLPRWIRRDAPPLKSRPTSRSCACRGPDELLPATLRATTSSRGSRSPPAALSASASGADFGVALALMRSPGPLPPPVGPRSARPGPRVSRRRPFPVWRKPIDRGSRMQCAFRPSFHTPHVLQVGPMDVQFTLQNVQRRRRW